MPLQNRVDPFGEIHAVGARGMLTGNRGVIHDPATRTLLKRRWSTKAWIICACEFDGRRREVMGRNARSGNAGWTELFFLDEVTALAAGHRPCFFCRRDKAKEYIDCFGKAFGVARPKVAEIDARLHAERWASGGRLDPATAPGRNIRGAGKLPDGAMVHHGYAAYALRCGKALRWSFAGYGEPLEQSVLDREVSQVLTPPTTVAVLAAGYRPVWHGSAAA